MKHAIRRAVVLAAFVAGIATACGSAPRPSSTPAGPTPTPPSAAAEVRTGVTYCTRDGIDLLMDLYIPRERREPSPAILFMHAGAWALGDRTVTGGVTEFEPYVQAGYFVASIDYRLAGEAKFPAQIQDAMCAVRSLRAHAAEYGIDGGRIAAMGVSAGGHLAALLGVVHGDEFGDVAEHADQSSRVQAVVDLFGPADLQAPDFVSAADDVARQVFGADRAGPSDALRSASPVTYVSGDAAPFLIIHGGRDTVVPLNQSQALDMRLTAAGVEHRLIVVANAEHGLVPSGGAMRPGVDELIGDVIAFLDETVGPAR